jgi:hypothetical protein
MTTVIQAYRFALDPTPGQRRALASHCGAARFAYNWGLNLVKQRLEQRPVRPGRSGSLDVAATAVGVEPGQASGRPLVD